MYGSTPDNVARFDIKVDEDPKPQFLSKEIAEDIGIGAAISRSMSDREIERISTLIPEVLESKAEIVDNRSLYY